MNKVCICIPTYNAQSTIKATLESIIQQTYRDIMVLIVDNCSTDNTLEIVRAFNDSRIIVHENTSNIGAEANFNRCIELSNGEYTAIYHADDVYDKTIVQKQVQAFQANIKLGLVLTGAQLIDQNSKPIRVCSVPSSVKTSNNEYNFIQLIKGVMEHGNFMFCPSAMVKTSIYKNEIKKWRGELFGSSSDLDIWLRIASAHTVAIMPEPLLHYRISNTQFSEQVRRKTTRADFFKVMDYYLQPPLLLNLSNKDKNNYRILQFRDTIMRSYNWYYQKTPVHALSLTNEVFSRKTMALCVQSKRGIKTWLFGMVLRIDLLLGLNFLGRIIK